MTSTDDLTSAEQRVRAELDEEQADIDRGKGTWPQPDYVTDESWARMHGRRDGLACALRIIEAVKASTPTGEPPPKRTIWTLAEAAQREVDAWPEWKRRAADQALVTPVEPDATEGPGYDDRHTLAAQVRAAAPTSDTAEGPAPSEADAWPAEARREAQRLLGHALDVIVHGHTMCNEDWERACVLAGRHCAPYLRTPAAPTVEPPEPTAAEERAGILAEMERWDFADIDSGVWQQLKAYVRAGMWRYDPDNVESDEPPEPDEDRKVPPAGMLLNWSDVDPDTGIGDGCRAPKIKVPAPVSGGGSRE